MKEHTTSVEECSIQEKKTQPPQLFSLLHLQAAISRRYKLLVQQTLDITQALREKYKAIAYNLSDCLYISGFRSPASSDQRRELYLNDALYLNRTNRLYYFNNGNSLFFKIHKKTTKH
ncbi:DNA topoisomerase [Dongshaea marina]|uniref:DNA topoisomerase n=1 Tax=Dongshaea marina TaxID=2047966 RepID=UPI000D3E0E7E